MVLHPSDPLRTRDFFQLASRESDTPTSRQICYRAVSRARWRHHSLSAGRQSVSSRAPFPRLQSSQST